MPLAVGERQPREGDVDAGAVEPQGLEDLTLVLARDRDLVGAGTLDVNAARLVVTTHEERPVAAHLEVDGPGEARLEGDRVGAGCSVGLFDSLAQRALVAGAVVAAVGSRIGERVDA